MVNNAVIKPNLGIYNDRPSIALNKAMLQDGLNFRIKAGKITNLNLGWERFEPTITLNGPIVLIDTFFIRGLTERLIFGTPTDLYVYDANLHTVAYITPTYTAGTVTITGTSVNVVGTGTLWAANARIGDEISFGSATVTNPAATWYTISNVVDNTHITLSVAAPAVAGVVYTLRRKFAGSVLNIWNTETFLNAAPANEDQWFATNGIDPVVRWNGITAQVTSLTTLSFTSCKSLIVYANMMVYGNIIQAGASKPTDIVNSHIGEPANVSSGLAGQFRVHSSSDPIVQLKRLGDTLSIYSDPSGGAGGRVTVAQFIGSPLIFAFRTAVVGKGPIAPRAIGVFGDYHEFLAKSGQYRFDGVTVKESGKQFWREVLRTTDGTRTALSYTAMDEENGDLIWVTPLTIDPNSGTTTAPPSRASVEHYLEDVGDINPKPMSLRSWPFTASGFYTRSQVLTWDQLINPWNTYNFRWDDKFFFANFPTIIAGDTTGKIFLVNVSQDAAGVALPSFAKFGRRAAMDGKMRALVTRVYPFVTTFTTPIKVTLNLTDSAMGPVAIADTQSFSQTLGQGGHFSTHYRRGRFLELQFGTDGPAQPYEVSGYDVEVKPGGRR